MAKDQSTQEYSCYILNFFYDERNSRALTPFPNEVRFYIIVDADEPKSSKREPLLQCYLDLSRAVKTRDSEADEATAEGLDDAQPVTAAPEQARRSDTEVQQDNDSVIDLRADQDKL